MSRGCAIGIDPGERWIGVARAASGSSLALPGGTLDRRVGDEETAEALRSMLGDEDVAELVIGVPLRPDGREDAQATAFRQFGEKLAASLDAVCIPQNERYSSGPSGSERTNGRSSAALDGRKSRAPGRKSIQRQRRDRQRSHAAAAARILQRWLDSREGDRARERVDVET